MKKIIIAIIIVIAAIFGWLFLPKETPEISEPEEKYSWEQRLGPEDVSKRTPTTRDYVHPTDPNKRVKIIASDIINPLVPPVFGATSTSSTNNKDAYMVEADPNGQYGGGYTEMTIGSGGGGGSDGIRALIHFTLSAGSGTITDVKLYLYCDNDTANTTIDIHELTQVSWTENGCTWNKYDGTNNWTAAGGDYTGTIIDSYAHTQVEWENWVLMGTGATNPLTLTWEDNTHLLLKANDEEPDNTGGQFLSKEYTGTAYDPYLEITYTPPAAPAASITPPIIIMGD